MSATAVQAAEPVQRTPEHIIERYRANRDWKLYEKEWIYHQFAPAGRSWLDFGCGTGEIATQLVKLGATRVIGIDVTEELIERARRRAELDGVQDRVKFHCADIASLEVEPVDVVLSYAVLHHLPDRLNEVVPVLRRWLKPGGVFICVEPVCYLSMVSRMRDWLGLQQDELDPGERQLTGEDLREITRHFCGDEKQHFHLFARFSRVMPKADRLLRQIDSRVLAIPGCRFAAGTVIVICRRD